MVLYDKGCLTLPRDNQFQCQIFFNHNYKFSFTSRSKISFVFYQVNPSFKVPQQPPIRRPSQDSPPPSTSTAGRRLSRPTEEVAHSTNSSSSSPSASSGNLDSRSKIDKRQTLFGGVGANIDDDYDSDGRPEITILTALCSLGSVFLFAE